MEKIKIPAFNETDFFRNRESKNATVWTVKNADENGFSSYCDLILENGYAKKEEYANDSHSFAAFEKDGEGVFLNCFGAIDELRIVIEENCNYFSFRDAELPNIVEPQITQIKLEDFGLSYAIRLSDGRFIVIDGGWNFEPDVERLFKCLKKDSPFEKPIIAAWILSHPHEDHFHCFIGFMEKYGSHVTLEKCLFNFPDTSDEVHYPRLDVDHEMLGNLYSYIPMMLAAIEKNGATIYTTHTGQKFEIGDACLEILSSMDDTIHVTDNINATSLVIRMTLGGQTILWTNDAGFSYARLPERYGSYLKSDILQIPHHGFQSGTAAAEIAGYDLIKPKICFLPVSDYCAYTFFCPFREGTRHIMTADCVEELITGTVQRTITLPYTARREAKHETERKLALGLDNDGARSWIFTNLSTGREEDMIFTVLNTTLLPVEVNIELFFEDKKQVVKFIKAQVGGSSIKTFNIVGDEVDGNALYFSRSLLSQKGVPENAPFAVRFMCDTPIVVSHKDHQPTYRSTLN